MRFFNFFLENCKNETINLKHESMESSNILKWLQLLSNIFAITGYYNDQRLEHQHTDKFIHLTLHTDEFI